MREGFGENDEGEIDLQSDIGSRNYKKYIADILDKLEQYGYEASAYQTTAEQDSAKKRRQEQQKLALI